MDTDPSAMIAVGVVMPVLGIFTVALRFYTRHIMKNQIGVDDWLLIPALILTIGMGASLIVGMLNLFWYCCKFPDKTGVRLHALGYPTPITGDPNDPLVTLTETNSAITITSQIEWAFQMMQVLALGCVKLSFLFFYRRVFCGRTSTVFGKVAMGIIAIVVIWIISFFFALLFACKGNWSAWWGSVLDLSTKCVETLKLELALVTSDFITDVLIMVIPIPMIWGLHMPIGRKIAVTGVFLLGAVSIAASIVRMNQFIQVIQVGFDPHADEDLSLTANLYWSMVESGIGLLAVCLPTFRALFGKDGLLQSFRSVFSINSRSSRSQQTTFNSVKIKEASSSTENFARGGNDQPNSGLNTYAMHDLRDRDSGDALPENGIMVQNTIERAEV